MRNLTKSTFLPAILSFELSIQAPCLNRGVMGDLQLFGFQTVVTGDCYELGQWYVDMTCVFTMTARASGHGDY